MSQPTPVRGHLPPVVQTAVASMALVIAAGIYMAAFLPHQAPLALPTGLIAAGLLLLLTSGVMLLRLRDFAWDRFWQVSGWAFLAYLVIAGMLEYVLAVDLVRGALLGLMTVVLLVFAVDIPVVLGFSVARHQ